MSSVSSSDDLTPTMSSLASQEMESAAFGHTKKRTRQTSSKRRGDRNRDQDRGGVTLSKVLSFFLPVVFMYLTLPKRNASFEGSHSSRTRRLAPFEHILTHRAGPVVPTDLTLRDVLGDTTGEVHLAMAPAFFGFYGYFGALQAWEELGLLDSTASFAGASAGAMAAILLAAGIPPSVAADFCRTNVSLTAFADAPAALSFFKGDEFEKIMFRFLHEHMPATHTLTLDDELNRRVAVTAFDIKTRTTKVLTRGSMARAARASATFPMLFQPVVWDKKDVQHDASLSTPFDQQTKDYLLIDGGVQDTAGLQGLLHTMKWPRSGASSKTTIFNLCVGDFHMGWHRHQLPTVPEELAERADRVIFVALHNLPQPSPLAMYKGPLAINAARAAMAASLDAALEEVATQSSYGPKQFVLHIDASKFRY